MTAYTVSTSPGGRSCFAVPEGIRQGGSCLVSDLTPSTAYAFRVTASNAAGSSLPSEATLPVQPLNLSPAPPIDVRVKPGNSEVEVFWEASNISTQFPDTAYQVYSDPGNFRCLVIVPARSCSVQGLTRGTNYIFRVRALSGGGWSAWSRPSDSVRIPQAPSPPVEISGLPGSGQVQVSWNAPVSDGGSPISGYTVTASPGGQICSTMGALTCTVTGLTNGTSYIFTVTATNSAGTSQPSESSDSVVPTESISKPPKITDLAVKSRKRRVIVTWSPPTNLGGSDSVSYQYRINKKKWTETNKTRIVVRGKSGKKITVRVRAVNEAGPGPAARVSGRVR